MFYWLKVFLTSKKPVSFEQFKENIKKIITNVMQLFNTNFLI